MSGTAVKQFFIANDYTTEGQETLRFTLDNKGISVDLLINDTSISQYNYTVLSLASMGINNQNNNIFKDASVTNLTVNRQNTPTQGSFTPYSRPDGKWAVKFNGTSDYLTVPSGVLPTTGDFTVEAYINPSDIKENNTVFYLNGNPSNTLAGLRLVFRKSSQSVVLLMSTDGAGWQILSGSGLNSTLLNTWSHVAVVRNGNNINVYVNGALKISSQAITSASQLYAGTENFIGKMGYSDPGYFAGTISNVRITGSALYTGSFVHNAAPLTAVSGTTLLTCQSNRFKDNSSAKRTVTPGGTPAVVANGPFRYDAYEPAVHGGSLAISSTNNEYIYMANNPAFLFGAGDYTVELWIYPLARIDSFVAGVWSQLSPGKQAWGIFTDPDGSIRIVVDPQDTEVNRASTVYFANAWNHIAITRSGTTFRLFVNGKLVNTGALTGWTMQAGTGQLDIGNLHDHGALGMRGYISDVRVVKGAALYSTDFTVPVAPVTAVDKTTVLLNFTNAGIVDSAAMADLGTIADARVSTTTVRPGKAKSVYFDGSGDYLKAPNANQQYSFGTGDFTVECWVNRINHANLYQTFASVNSDNAGAGNTVGYGWQFGFTTIMQPTFVMWNSNTAASSMEVRAATPLASGVWAHIAVVRRGNQLSMFVNGIKVATNTISDGFNVAPNPDTLLNIGTYANNYWGNCFGGYLDDLIITKGFAKYDSNFTPL